MQSTDIRVLMALAVVTGVVAVAAIMLVAAVAFIDPFGDAPHPTDDVMLRQFVQVRPQLEALARMIEQDPVPLRVAANFTRPDPAPVSAERLADYRSRLAAAGIARGFSHYGDIQFIVSTRGLAIAGSGKSFVYAAEPDPDAVVIEGDLDGGGALPEHREGVLLRRRIADNWWLELDTR